jgi:hypothetical protein
VKVQLRLQAEAPSKLCDLLLWCIALTLSKVKAKLDDAITQARARITSEDARGFFKHCGFPLPAQ